MGNCINKTKNNKLKPLWLGSNEPSRFDCWRHSKPPLAFSSPQHYNEVVMRLKA